MSAATAQTNQRKRKRDSEPDLNTKRRRSNEILSKVTEDRQQISPLQGPMSRSVLRRQASVGTDGLGAMPGYSNATDGPDNLASEDDLSNSELSSNVETSSDSGISSSESEDETDEEDNADRESTLDDITLDRPSLNDEIDTISITAQTKPAISGSASPSRSTDLRSKIATFLPQLRKANEDLANAEDDRRIDAVADGQDHYIEMDLGLGVLKGKRRPKLPHGEIQTHDISTSSGSSSSSGGDDDETDTGGSGEDVMSKLLGKKEKRTQRGRPVIQPLGET